MKLFFTFRAFFYSQRSETILPNYRFRIESLRLTKIGGHLVHIHIGEPGVDAQLPLFEDLPVGLRLVLLVQ
jgi:hypothetical protein